MDSDKLAKKIASVLLVEMHGITNIGWVEKHCPSTFEEVTRLAKAVAKAVEKRSE